MAKIFRHNGKYCEKIDDKNDKNLYHGKNGGKLMARMVKNLQNHGEMARNRWQRWQNCFAFFVMAKLEKKKANGDSIPHFMYIY